MPPVIKQKMLVKDVIQVLEQVAPSYLQETYDNSGLLVGTFDTEVTGILCCLDSTEAVVEEAVRKGCNLIVAHHPIVFRGLKRLNGANYVERTVIKAIRAGVAIYAIHTNLDNVHRQGVNAKIAEKLGLQRTRVLVPRTGLEGIGAGLWGELDHPMAETDFLQLLKNQLYTNYIRHTALLGKPIQRVAVCGGSGSFLLTAARQSSADAFVTADFKYHEFFDADSQILIADVGHYESEQFTIQLLHDIIREKFPTFAVHCTDLNTNPVFYA